MRVSLRVVWLLLLGSAALSGCTSLKQTLANKECRLAPGKPYDVVTVELKRHAIVLVSADASGAPLYTLTNAQELLEARGDSVIALTNGGIYTRDYKALGLYVEAGRTLVPLNRNDGYGNFYLKPNGVFVVSGDSAYIIDAAAYDAAAPAPDYALQSGPLLVLRGSIHPAFRPGSTNCRLRSGIGVDADGRVHLAISNGAVNFYDFARLFKQVLRCDNALYLDGTISAFHAPATGHHHRARKRFATFLAVLARR